MNQHVRHLLAWLAAALTVLLPAVASAQIAVEVTPLRVELKTGPGGTYTQAVKLVNHGKEAVRIHTQLNDWYLSKDGTPQFKLVAPGADSSAAAWLRLNPVDLVAQPGVETIVRFTLTVPAGTQEGGYRAALMFDFSPPGADAALVGHGIAFKSRVATLVYATVGSPKPAVEMTDLQPRIQAGQPPAVVATLKNTSRVHVRTQGEVIVYGQGNTIVRRLLVPDVPVLPASERDVVIALVEGQQPALAPGQYRLEVKIDVGLPVLLVGETTITIEK